MSYQYAPVPPRDVSFSPSNIALPNQVFSSPYYGQAYAHPPPVATSSMGPPSRPVDKPTDINDLGDVLVGSGIDLREEEAAMYRSMPEQPARPYPFPRDHYYSPHVPGDRSSFYGAGTFNQPPYQSSESLVEAEKKRAVRRREEIRQYHLNQPFLLTGNLRRRFDREKNKNHVRFDDSGLWTPRAPLAPREYHIVGPDGNHVLRLLHQQDILQKDTTLAEILALISLATEERLRVLIEDAALLARERKSGSLGMIPPDLAPSQPDLFIPPLNKVAQALQDTAKKDRTFEEHRLAKRQKRKAGESFDVSLDSVAPDVDVKKAVPAKKSLKGQIDNATQAQQIAALNKTTQMALGGKQLPSWMKKGADSGPSNPYLARTNSTSQKPSPDVASQVPKVRSFGDFREDRDDGKGIQLRDLLLALEENAHEKKSLQKAYKLLA